MMKVPFTKLVGAGNDFVLVDTRRQPLSALRTRWRGVAKMLCDPRQGIGADGLLVLGRSRTADVRMRVFNPDGTEPSMCGNGVRCLAWYVYRRGAANTHLAIETKAGIKRAQILGGHRVRIDMGVPRFSRRVVSLRVGHRRLSNVALVDSGVPHLVCWVDDVARVNVEAIGRRVRRHRRFQPHGVNVDFVECASWHRRLGAARRHIRLKMRTYERGVEGETQACGTGAVAAAAAAVQAACFASTPHSLTGAADPPTTLGRPHHREGRVGRQADQWDVDVRVPGGLLRVTLKTKWVSSGKRNGRLIFLRAFLEGEARQVSRGTVTWNGRHPA